jgi:hypothetical protein
MSGDDLTLGERFAIWRYRWLPYRCLDVIRWDGLDPVFGRRRWCWPALRRIRGGREA